MSINKKKKGKVVVAMSGGVDSSTVATILHKEGYEVIGVTLHLYTTQCKQNLHDAKIMAGQIGIPHYVQDYETFFKEEIIDDFADSYIAGETPNPCAKCNKKVKFGKLFKIAKDLGADALATGHYVRKAKIGDEDVLLKAIDENKDQSYFLFAIDKEQIGFLKFPLGNLEKEKTRKLAKKYGLNVADKPESQDICFVPSGGYSQIIKKLRPESYKSGDIVLKDGKVLGRHDGIVDFTVGQRRKIGVSYEKPLYVIRIDAENNRVIVGEQDDLKASKLQIKGLNWLADDKNLKNEIECSVRLRSSHKEIEATVKYLGNGYADVILNSAYYGITPGQACVMYDRDRLLGGGWIMKEGIS